RPGARACGGAAGSRASQNITGARLGTELLDLIKAGTPADQAVARVAAAAPHASYRQLTAVDADGVPGAYLGEHTLGRHATAQDPGAVAAGNLLAAEDVPAAMLAA